MGPPKRRGHSYLSHIGTVPLITGQCRQHSVTLSWRTLKGQNTETPTEHHPPTWKPSMATAEDPTHTRAKLPIMGVGTAAEATLFGLMRAG